MPFGKQNSFKQKDTVTIRGWKSWGPARIVKENEDGTYHVAFIEGASEILSVKSTIIHKVKEGEENADRESGEMG